MTTQKKDWALDYIDVATRIAEFRTKYPSGSLQQVDLQFVEVAGAAWVVYTAAAYRSPLDERPGHGTAWEPVPGKTNFTRDSELQNAETAAWGRAIVAALAADTRKGVASGEEVRNRAEENVNPRLVLENAVLAAGRRAGFETLDVLRTEYAEWSRGEILTEADDAQLEEFLTHLNEAADKLKAHRRLAADTQDTNLDGKTPARDRHKYERSDDARDPTFEVAAP